MPARPWLRWMLLLLILVASTRLVWRLDAKNLWWDESMSLQRAESGWPALLAGRLIFSDGHNQLVTIDQHPFGYFVLLGLFVRILGSGEFSLRFLSVIAGTLLVPMTWTFAQLLARARVLPRSAPVWAALLVAASPFLLWYGQEARSYTLWPLLALLSTYLLLRWAAASDPRSRHRLLAAYVAALAAFLSTHFFSVFLLPVHAVVIYRQTAFRSRHEAIFAAGGLLAAGLAVGLVVVLVIMGQPGAGANFAAVSLRMLAPDLVNAFSMGLSVDLGQVRWLDLIFALLAVAGTAWGLRSRQAVARGGWLLPAFVVVPVGLLLVLNEVRPAYMNARHMSVISVAFLILVAGGLGLLWNLRRWAGGAAGTLLVVAMVYSSWNYFTVPQYGKDDFVGVGSYLEEHIQPGDLVLLEPPEMLRLFQYYLPFDALERGASAGLGTAWEGTPLVGLGMEQTYARLGVLRQQHRRIWLVVSGMYPLTDPGRQVGKWLRAKAFLVREEEFHSASANLRLDLFLPQAPVQQGEPPGMQHAVDAVFGDRVRLAGYDLGTQLASGGSVPVTLYWQALRPMDRRYKYILRLEQVGADGVPRTISLTEREPYDGTPPTTSWKPGQTIVEYSGVTGPAQPRPETGPYRLTLQVYDADTLVKLPLSHTGAQAAGDGETLILSSAFQARSAHSTLWAGLPAWSG